MAADRKIALLIVAKDTASAVVKGVGAGIGKIAAGIKGSFSKLGSAFTGINQGLEIAKKGMMLLGAAYGATVGKALELRAANDPAKMAIEGLGKAANDLGVAIGDVLMPAIDTLAGALTPLINDTITWLNTNRKMIAENLVPWLVSVGRTMTEIVAKGAVLAVKAFQGWGLIIDLIAEKYHRMNANAALEEAAALRTASLNKLISAEQFRSMNMRAAAIEKAALAEEQASTAARRSFEETITAIAATEASADALAKKIQEGIGKAGVAALDHFYDGAKRASTGIAGLKDSLDFVLANGLAAVAERDAAELAAFEASIARKRKETSVDMKFNDLVTADRKRHADLRVVTQNVEAEKARDSLMEVAGVATGAVMTVGGAVSGMIAAAREGTQTAGQLIGGFFDSLATAAINSIVNMVAEWAAGQLAMTIIGAAAANERVAQNTAVAASAAISAYAGIPVAGIILGLAAAAGVIAAIASVSSFHSGGMVGGAGEVPAVLQTGEYVTKRSDVARNVAAGRAPGDNGGSRSSGLSASPGGGTTIIVDASNRSFMPESNASIDRRINKRLIPALQRSTRSGRTFT